MNREKRHTALPVPYQIPLICYPRVRKKNRNKVKLPPCEYQVIPYPLKFIYVSGTYLFYGGASLREREGTLKTETALLSQYLRCEEVKVIKGLDQKIVSMKLQKLPAFRYPAWQPMIERLEESESLDIRGWAAILKDYCLKYEEKLRAWTDEEVFRSQYSEDALKEMNRRSEEKIAEYFKQYPCMNFRATLEDKQMQQSEIVLSDRYLEQLGYTIDSFAVTTLRDGIPQLLPVDNTIAARLYIKNYHSLEDGGCATPEIPSELVIRKGYTRKTNFKAHYFATYRDKTFGMDCVVMITGTDSTNFSATTPQGPKLSKSYLKKEIAKEKQTSKFLQEYYNKSFDLQYTNMSKICKIRDLETDTSKVCKIRDLGNDST